MQKFGEMMLVKKSSRRGHPVAYQNGGTFAAIVPDDEGYDQGHCRCWEGLGVAAYEKRGKEICRRWRYFVKIRR